MKKILLISMIGLLLSGCGTDYEGAEVKLEPTAGEYFTLIKEWGGGTESGYYQIVYANDTKVKYFIWKEYNRGGITPLYNEDGSLQVYDEVKESD